jgi:type VI secretion system protein ImpC
MPDPLSFGSLPAAPAAPPKPGPETPFRIAVLGNFGRAAGAAPPLADRRPVKVRHETLDDVLAARRPLLRLSAAGERVELTFSSMDDFHPDQIFDQVEALADGGEDERNDLMRAILHHRDFQTLESAWRGLEWLLRRAARGRVEVVFYDVPRDELAADLTASEDLSRSALYGLLVEKATAGPKGERWGLLVGDYLFDRSAADARLLGRIAKIASHAGAPFLAGAAPAVHASADMPPTATAAWDALRRLPEAALLGLTLPRFLLRPPYGPDTSSIDRFDFEEFSRDAGRKPYLWGNGALACAALVAQSFQKQGWAFQPGALLDLTDLPMHVGTDEDGDPVATVGEAWVDRRLADPLGRQGFMCLLGVRGVNALQLARFQSLAPPPANRPFADLQGPWGQAGVGPSVSAGPPVTVQVGFDARAVPAPPAAPTEAAAPAEPQPDAGETEAVEDELASLLQDLDPAPSAEAPAPTEAAPPADEADAELDALLKELGGA